MKLHAYPDTAIIVPLLERSFQTGARLADLYRLSDSRGPLKTHVIFLHGLGGDPRYTWQATADVRALWPLWLAEDIDGLAVWSVGYEAPVSRWRGTAMHLVDRAENILGRLRTEPALSDGRIILIGHSLGGLVIKQLCRTLDVQAPNDARAASLLDRIDKVAFLATPHTGADLAIWGDRLRILVRPSAVTLCLVRNDPNLRDLNNWYRDWANEKGLSHLVLRETKPIRVLGTIVKPDSADPGLHRVRVWPTDHDHISIAKPRRRSDEVYGHVREFIRDPFERPKPRIEHLAEQISAGQEEIRQDTRSIRSDTQDILDVLKGSRQGPEIAVVFGNDSFALSYADAEAIPPSNELELPWQPLENAVQPDDCNLLDALRWNFGLVEQLHGRDHDLAEIINWAERRPAVPSARLVTGEGGSGKTRLAAAAAADLRERGWTAGFLSPGKSLRIETGKTRGVFLILDYPEENLDLTRALIKWLAGVATSACPMRLLLLSRRDFDHWQPETLILEGRFGNHPIAAPGELRIDDVCGLIESAAARFAKHAGLPNANLDRAKAWAEQESLHRLPLFAAAAAIHAVLAPREAFGIEGKAIIGDLVNRERARVQRTSDRLGIGRNTLGRLLALGVLGHGLTLPIIGQLADAGICDEPLKNLIGQKVTDTPWWKNGRLVRLQPDRLAAVFLSAELFGAALPDGDPRMPAWLSIALTGAEDGFGGRLGRILYDLDSSGVAAGRLEKQLNRMIEEDPRQAGRFDDVASGEVPYAASGFAAAVALALADLSGDEPASRAACLSHASNFLSRLGRREDALAAATEAAHVYRNLARAQPEAFRPALATSLGNVARTLAEIGRREDALATATEAAEIYRDLARTQPEAFAPDLAASLNNLAGALSGLRRHGDALTAAREAAGICRDLARAQPEVFTPKLAMTLHNLAGVLLALDRHEDALSVVTEVVTIRRDLARSRPEVFTPQLAGSLDNLAQVLSALGRHGDALAAAMEAVAIRRDLARAA